MSAMDASRSLLQAVDGCNCVCTHPAAIAVPAALGPLLLLAAALIFSTWRKGRATRHGMLVKHTPSRLQPSEAIFFSTNPGIDQEHYDNSAKQRHSVQTYTSSPANPSSLLVASNQQPAAVEGTTSHAHPGEGISVTRRSLIATGGVPGADMDSLELLATLGEGTYGKVYKANWKGIIVAVKVMVLTGEEKRQKMAVMEAAISSTLSHPNIVQTFTFSVKPLTDARHGSGRFAIGSNDTCGRARHPSSNVAGTGPVTASVNLPMLSFRAMDSRNSRTTAKAPSRTSAPAHCVSCNLTAMNRGDGVNMPGFESNRHTHASSTGLRKISSMAAPVLSGALSMHHHHHHGGASGSCLLEASQHHLSTGVASKGMMGASHRNSYSSGRPRKVTSLSSHAMMAINNAAAAAAAASAVARVVFFDGRHLPGAAAHGMVLGHSSACTSPHAADATRSGDSNAMPRSLSITQPSHRKSSHSQLAMEIHEQSLRLLGGLPGRDTAAHLPITTHTMSQRPRTGEHQPSRLSIPGTDGSLASAANAGAVTAVGHSQVPDAVGKAFIITAPVASCLNSPLSAPQHKPPQVPSSEPVTDPSNKASADAVAARQQSTNAVPDDRAPHIQLHVQDEQVDTQADIHQHQSAPQVHNPRQDGSSPLTLPGGAQPTVSTAAVIGDDHDVAGGSPGPASAEGLGEWEVWMVQEFCEAGSLRDLLDKGGFASGGRLDMVALIDTALDVSRAMEHLHEQHIVHSDLKPRNVLLKANPMSARGFVAKVADFGLATRVSPDTGHVTNVFQGTLSHMAPEVLQSGQLGKPADVFAFGTLLWEMYTGERPFRGMTKAVLLDALVKHGTRPTFPQHAPQQLVSMAQQCWSISPSARPTFKEILASLQSMWHVFGGGSVVASTLWGLDDALQNIGAAQSSRQAAQYAKHPSRSTAVLPIGHSVPNVGAGPQFTLLTQHVSRANYVRGQSVGNGACSYPVNAVYSANIPLDQERPSASSANALPRLRSQYLPRDSGSHTAAPRHSVSMVNVIRHRNGRDTGRLSLDMGAGACMGRGVHTASVSPQHHQLHLRQSSLDKIQELSGLLPEQHSMRSGLSIGNKAASVTGATTFQGADGGDTSNVYFHEVAPDPPSPAVFPFSGLRSQASMSSCHQTVSGAASGSSQGTPSQASRSGLSPIKLAYLSLVPEHNSGDSLGSAHVVGAARASHAPGSTDHARRYMLEGATGLWVATSAASGGGAASVYERPSPGQAGHLDLYALEEEVMHLDSNLSAADEALQQRLRSTSSVLAHHHHHTVQGPGHHTLPHTDTTHHATRSTALSHLSHMTAAADQEMTGAMGTTDNNQRHSQQLQQYLFDNDYIQNAPDGHELYVDEFDAFDDEAEDLQIYSHASNILTSTGFAGMVPASAGYHAIAMEAANRHASFTNMHAVESVPGDVGEHAAAVSRTLRRSEKSIYLEVTSSSNSSNYSEEDDDGDEAHLSNSGARQNDSSDWEQVDVDEKQKPAHRRRLSRKICSGPSHVTSPPTSPCPDNVPASMGGLSRRLARSTAGYPVTGYLGGHDPKELSFKYRVPPDLIHSPSGTNAHLQQGTDAHHSEGRQTLGLPALIDEVMEDVNGPPQQLHAIDSGQVLEPGSEDVTFRTRHPSMQTGGDRSSADTSSACDSTRSTPHMARGFQ